MIPPSTNSSSSPDNGRREFLKKSSAATIAASALAFPGITRAKSFQGTIRVGLIGCGGRGSGAAGQALSADKDVKLTAVADVFEGQLNGSLNKLKNNFGDKVEVDDANKFLGLDAYQKVIDSDVDMVILTTPPGFRPMMLKAAIEAGKHVFCEKPVAVDAPACARCCSPRRRRSPRGSRWCAASAGATTTPAANFLKRIHGGQIGEIQQYVLATYYTGPVKPMPPESHDARRGWPTSPGRSRTGTTSAGCPATAWSNRRCTAWIRSAGSMQDANPVRIHRHRRSADPRQRRQHLRPLPRRLRVRGQRASATSARANSVAPTARTNDYIHGSKGTRGDQVRNCSASSAAEEQLARTAPTTSTTTCTRRSTTTCSSPSAKVPPSTMASGWPIARCSGSPAASPPTPARGGHLG